MAKKVVRYKLVRHKWPDEIEAEKKRRNRMILTVLACILFFSGGFLTSSLINGGTLASSKNEDFSKLYEIYNAMNTNFYFGKDKENFSQTLINGAINGMVTAGEDKHTKYLDSEQSQSFTSSMEGSFVGIGVSYYEQSKGVFIISSVYQDSPAEAVGISEGDQIYAVNGELVSELSLNDVADKIKGAQGSTVKIEIIRENVHHTFDVERGQVLTSVHSSVNGDIGVIELSSFADTSGEEMGNHLKSLKGKGCTKLIIDLRDNSGGYVIAAQQIASYLLPDDVVIYQEKDKAGNVKEYKTIKDYPKYDFDQIVIVVNGETASASELLTAALKESGKAIVVGEQTYGKGTVQVPVPFKDGSMFKYTVYEWLSGKGNSINEKGIAPDEIVSLDPAFSMGAPKLEDNEVYKADTVNIAAKSVQTYLKFLGYSVDRTDSYFSKASSLALAKYQSEKGLEATGTIDNKTINSLISSCSLKWAAEKESLDLQMKKAVELLNGR